MSFRVWLCFGVDGTIGSMNPHIGHPLLSSTSNTLLSFLLVTLPLFVLSLLSKSPI